MLLETSFCQKDAKKAKAVLTVFERTKFRTLVKSGETLLYRTEVASVNEAGGKVKVMTSRNNPIAKDSGEACKHKFSIAFR